MRTRICAVALAMLAIAACSKDDNSVGNGPGDADGLGGRKDPPAATQTDPANASGESASPNTAAEPATPSEPAAAESTPPAEH